MTNERRNGGGGGDRKYPSSPSLPPSLPPLLHPHTAEIRSGKEGVALPPPRRLHTTTTSSTSFVTRDSIQKARLLSLPPSLPPSITGIIPPLAAVGGAGNGRGRLARSFAPRRLQPDVIENRSKLGTCSMETPHANSKFLCSV